MVQRCLFLAFSLSLRVFIFFSLSLVFKQPLPSLFIYVSHAHYDACAHTHTQNWEMTCLLNARLLKDVQLCDSAKKLRSVTTARHAIINSAGHTTQRPSSRRITGMFNAEHKKAAARLRGYDASKNDPGTVSNAHTNHMPNVAFRVLFFRSFIERVFTYAHATSCRTLPKQPMCKPPAF